MNVLKPYTGGKEYIFISYSHKDSERVIPIIRHMFNNRFRVWYDEGIDPGTEWDENIATHIKQCSYFIAFISPNYIASENCKDELNFSRDLGKERLLIYLDEVLLPSGMSMRLNRLQAIHKYTYSSDADFYEKLFSASNITLYRDFAPAVDLTKTNIIASGTINSIEWTIKTDGSLHIAGHGEVPGGRATNTDENGEAFYSNHFCQFSDKIKTIIIEEGITSLGEAAFYKFVVLEEIILPTSLCRIEASAFEECYSLKNITLPDTVSYIGPLAFSHCRELKAINIPNNVKTIWEYTFDDCVSLEEVHLPDGLTELVDGAFYNCQEIHTLRVPSTVNTIEPGVFEKWMGDQVIIIDNCEPALPSSEYDWKAGCNAKIIWNKPEITESKTTQKKMTIIQQIQLHRKMKKFMKDLK